VVMIESCASSMSLYAAASSSAGISGIWTATNGVVSGSRIGLRTGRTESSDEILRYSTVFKVQATYSSKDDGAAARRISTASTPRLLRSKPSLQQPLMVEPQVAKQLAEADMQRRLRKANLQRQRRIEAENGGWAMLGLTAGLINEAYTGRGIIAQVADYLDAATTFLDFLSSQL